jgi:cytoskeleton protein RodZ
MVRARELTWLAVRVDGGDEREVLLREGEMVRWGAGQGFLLTVGNAGGVDLVLDGQPVSVPGRRGEVIRNLQLPPVTKSSP